MLIFLHLLIASFDKIDVLDSIIDKLKDLGYTTKPSKFHITLGDIDELSQIDTLYNIIQNSLTNSSLASELKKYLINQEWTLTYTTKELEKVSWAKQFSFKNHR